MLNALASALRLPQVWTVEGALSPPGYVLRLCPGLPWLAFMPRTDGNCWKWTVTRRAAFSALDNWMDLSEALLADELLEMLDEDEDELIDEDGDE